MEVGRGIKERFPERLHARFNIGFMEMKADNKAISQILAVGFRVYDFKMNW
jgi:hypothetical protein